MYIILGVTKEDNQVHRQTYSNYNRALNFMSYLQGNGVGFIMDKNFPSAYPKFMEACELIKGKSIENQTFNELEKIEKAQNFNATKILLSL